MGQVPSAKPWLLIGSGRLATHLAPYLRQLDVDCRQWSRARGWHDAPPGAAAGLDDALPHCDRVLLAISDDALAPFVRRHRRSDGPTWVHFSGSRRIDGARSAHPLCTFGLEPYAPELYPTIPFVVEAEGPPLDELLPGLPNPSAAVPAADKALYHSLCVAAGNFTTLLWQRFHDELVERWNIAPELAAPYLHRTVRNLETAHGRDVLTGPLARGDSETIAADLAALERAGLEDLAAVYRAFRDSTQTAREDAA